MSGWNFNEMRVDLAFEPKRLVCVCVCVCRWVINCPGRDKTINRGRARMFSSTWLSCQSQTSWFQHSSGFHISLFLPPFLTHMFESASQNVKDISETVTTCFESFLPFKVVTLNQLLLFKMYSLFYLSVQWNYTSECMCTHSNKNPQTDCDTLLCLMQVAWSRLILSLCSFFFFFSFALTLQRYFGRLLEWRLKLFQMDRWWVALKKKSLFYGIKVESGLLKAESDFRGEKGKERKGKERKGKERKGKDRSPLSVFLYSGWQGMRRTVFPKKPFARLISYLCISSPPTKTHRNIQTWRPHSHVLGDVFHVFYAVYTHIIFERGTNLAAVSCRWWSICWAH